MTSPSLREGRKRALASFRGGSSGWNGERAFIHPPRRLVPRLRPSLREGEVHDVQTRLKRETEWSNQGPLSRKETERQFWSVTVGVRNAIGIRCAAGVQIALDGQCDVPEEFTGCAHDGTAARKATLSVQLERTRFRVSRRELLRRVAPIRSDARKLPSRRCRGHAPGRSDRRCNRSESRRRAGRRRTDGRIPRGVGTASILAGIAVCRSHRLRLRPLGDVRRFMRCCPLVALIAVVGRFPRTDPISLTLFLLRKGKRLIWHCKN
jgi:hypothetical protein